MTDLSTLTHEHFAACLNQPFLVDAGEGTEIEVELVEAQSRGKAESGSETRQRFSLIFRGPMEPQLPQQIYALRHETLSDLQLFLVPVGPDARGLLYEAVFS